MGKAKGKAKGKASFLVDNVVAEEETSSTASLLSAAVAPNYSGRPKLFVFEKTWAKEAKESGA